MEQVVTISAIICTYNRSTYLRRSLDSLQRQTLAAEMYEIVVVDNASTDETRQVVCSEFAHVANLRYVYESASGLSHARNTGLRSARGAYVAYLDDDAVASPRWLETIHTAFQDTTPVPGAVGGKVEPLWEQPRPAWLSDKIINQLSVLDIAPAPLILEEGQWLVGANIAFPKQTLSSVGGFDESLGRRGSSLLSWEEILVQQRLRELGYRCLYHPAIAVQHHISASRLSQKWFLRRLYWDGVSAAVARTHQRRVSPLQRTRLAVEAARHTFLNRRLLTMALPTADPERFADKCNAWSGVGYIAGLYGLSH